jgi:hypothetical protein
MTILNYTKKALNKLAGCYKSSFLCHLENIKKRENNSKADL